MTQLLDQVNAALAGHERLQTIVVTQLPWSIENGFLTPTMKVKRSRIEGEVSTKVEGWYGARSKVQWA